MDSAQFRRRAHVGLSLIAHDLVGDAQLFQQPQHALGAGIVEMMDGEHGDFPEGMTLWRGVCWCQPEAAKSSRLGVSDITRMLLTAPIYPDNTRLSFEEACMNPGSDTDYIAFEGDRCIASGDLRDVARAAKETLARRKDASVLVFDGKSGPI